MQIITKIEIRKFRSIKSLTKDFEPKHLNILVGPNDNGKSNVLRALNLFFNNETDIDQPFRFDSDYCYHSNSGIGTKREVRIDLHITPPKSRFKNAQPIRWTKKWKRDGSIVEERIYIESGTEITQKDNIYKWLDKLKYRYVPAIKGREYFNSLMGKLHDVLNEAHDDVMASQGQGFISGIQEITQNITDELDRQIGVPNTIQVPSDFRDLFSNLDFGSTINNKVYHLKQRGDGIKVRHIPVILKFMEEQEKNISISGYVKPDTIWGFEEPENNLELTFSYQLAEAFRSYCKDIQIFLSTHSPAFYALDKTDTDPVNTYYVEKNSEGCTEIKLITHADNENLHEKMGLLPLITPYLNQVYAQQKEISELELKIDELTQKMTCCVITEDEKSLNLQTLLWANGFSQRKTELFSYKGKDQIKGAIILGRYLKSKRPEVVVVVHRDKDYLDVVEVERLADSFEKNNIEFFVTDGVDVESHYLNVEHIERICKDLSREQIEQLLQEATDEVEEESLGRLIDHTFTSSRPENNGYAKKLRTIRQKYIDDKVRYRYGKKVAGVFAAKVQKITKKNFDIYATSEGLKYEQLISIAEKINSDV